MHERHLCRYIAVIFEPLDFIARLVAWLEKTRNNG